MDTNNDGYIREGRAVSTANSIFTQTQICRFVSMQK